MRIEYWIILFVYILTTALIFIIPKRKFRLAVVAFLFKQFITSIVGLVVVQWGLLEYPIRLFPTVSRGSFTYEFFAFPVSCAIFTVFYPNQRSIWVKLGYYFTFTTVLTIGEVLIEKYTELIKYIHWEWYTSWFTILITFWMTREFCRWFFKKEEIGRL